MLGSGKTLSELHIHYKSLLTRIYDHAGHKESCKDFTVSLKMFNIYNKKQRYDSVTGNENAYKDCNCIILLQASLPETTHLCTENKLAEMTSNPRQPEQR